MAVDDIKRVQDVVARESKQLVYMHYNLMVCCDKGTDLQKPTNYLENSFGRLGIHISKRGVQPAGTVRGFVSRQLLRHESGLRPLPHPRRCSPPA